MYRFKYHTIRVYYPHIQSYAQAILLRWQLRKSAGDEVRLWLRYRKWYLRQHYKENHGRVICHYCGKTPLKRSTRTVEEAESLATIDHVHPLSKSGKRYDPKNLVVSCWPCNEKKGDKVLG